MRRYLRQFKFHLTDPPFWMAVGLLAWGPYLARSEEVQLAYASLCTLFLVFFVPLYSVYSGEL